LWVLKAAYQLSREDILAALEQLTIMPVLEFESDNVVTSLVRLGRSTQTDLPDLLIGLCARERGCEATWTLDKKVSRSDVFRVIA
jgi:predicted nucleic-acid-binding protein